LQVHSTNMTALVCNDVENGLVFKKDKLSASEPGPTNYVTRFVKQVKLFLQNLRCLISAKQQVGINVITW